MTINEGKYRCSVVNNVGSDELFYEVSVIPYYSLVNNNNQNHDYSQSFDHHSKIIQPIISSASSSDPQVSYNKNLLDGTDENADHLLFGLVLGILSGLFLVLVIFSIMFVFFLRKQKIVPHLVNPHELVMIDAIESTLDNNTLGDDDNHETNTETTERNISRNEFNPLLVVNPVKKPPRLGIPDVSSIYSHPSSWTMNRQQMNRSRYASYAEPIYSDYHSLYRPRRFMPPSRLDENNTFISDTASEV
ncbi:hypothetical protein QR98_0063070 [Sarcoptes scabiei]|nr:hypothetical protein QR98_0063070 [Sarcoptes scabiei]